jgi:hypothetical protein
MTIEDFSTDCLYDLIEGLQGAVEEGVAGADYRLRVAQAVLAWRIHDHDILQRMGRADPDTEATAQARQVPREVLAQMCDKHTELSKELLLLDASIKDIFLTGYAPILTEGDVSH